MCAYINGNTTIFEKGLKQSVYTDKIASMMQPKYVVSVTILLLI